MVKEFRIIIGHSSSQSTEVPLVLSGSEVSGTVLVRLDEPQRCQSVKIFLKGSGVVRWTRAQRDGVNAVYKEKERYVYLVIVLWDENRLPGTVYSHGLPAGEHHFPFRFTLPISLPSSYVGSADTVGSFYEGSVGQILYKLKAVIFAKPLNFESRKVPLRVIEAIDVNTPALDRPLQFEKQKTSLFWCLSGPVTMTVDIPRSGYCSEEEIPFQVTVANGTNHSIECVAQLQRHILFSVQSSLAFYNHRRRGPIVFHTTLRSPPIEAHSISTWAPEHRAFTIPKNTPVTINTKIIKRYYHLNMTVVIPNAKNLVIPIPITIGSVPHRQEIPPIPHSALTHSVALPEVQREMSEQPQACVEPPSYASTVETTTTSVPTLTSVDSEPPSYEEAVTM